MARTSPMHPPRSPRSSGRSPGSRVAPGPRAWPRAAAFAGAACLAAACGGGGDAAPDAGEGAYNCATETRADAFAVGLEKQGAAGRIAVRLVSATPAPPVRGDNTWIVQVAAGGAPVEGAAITATPFMPDHRHGTPITVQVTPTANAGEYTLAPVNLWMPGLWETTIEVQPTGQPKDAVIYRFCIPS